MTDNGVRVELVRLEPAALRGLADGDLAAAGASVPAALSPYLAGPECRWVWSLRADQVVAGRGLHGRGRLLHRSAVPPAGIRARGRVLLDRAAREPAVSTVRASVGPADEPSLDLVRSLGLVTVYELGV